MILKAIENQSNKQNNRIFIKWLFTIRVIDRFVSATYFLMITLTPILMFVVIPICFQPDVATNIDDF